MPRFLPLAAVVGAVLLASLPAGADSWAFSVGFAMGHTVRFREGNFFNTSARIGGGADAVRAVHPRVAVGAEIGWWEQIGYYGFTRPADLFPHAEELHLRTLMAGAVARVRPRGERWPYVLIGGGAYVVDRQYRYPSGLLHELNGTSGLNVGLGFCPPVSPAPAIELRWHHFFAGSMWHRDGDTDMILISGAVRFQ